LGIRGNLAQKPSPKLKFGEILLRQTSLTPAQLDEALNYPACRRWPARRNPRQRNFILPHEIMRALCVQIGLTFVEDLKANEIDPKLVTEIPINYAKAKEVIPLYREQTPTGEELVVGDFRSVQRVAIERSSRADRNAHPTRREYEHAYPGRDQSRLRAEVFEPRRKIEGEFDETYDLEGPIDILDANEDDAPVIKSSTRSSSAL